MRYLLFVTLILAIIVIPVTAIGCGDSGITGKYVDRDYPDRYHIELYKDGTFHTKEDKVSYDGTWKIEGDQLTFTLDNSERTMTATIKEIRITDEFGNIFVKQQDK
jgi:hypothetical protein